MRLEGKVAVVAGATRGAGRGIAIELGSAGATVYCIGRSVRGNRSEIDRRETIEETAERVSAEGGRGIWVQTDLREPDQVRQLFERVEADQGKLDILVNNLSGDQFLTKGMLSGKESVPFWEYSIEKGLAVQRNGIHTHLISAHYAAARMVKQKRGLVVEVNDGNAIRCARVGAFYNLSKASLVLLAYFMAEELREHNVAAVSLTPGWLRSEQMLDGFGVSEANWQDAVDDAPDFAKSETPHYIGRAVVALASDENIMSRTGHALSVGYLAREYGFTDIDGRQPPGYYPEGAFENGYFQAIEPKLFEGWG